MMIPKRRSGTIWLILVVLTLSVILSDWSKTTAYEVQHMRGISG